MPCFSMAYLRLSSLGVQSSGKRDFGGGLSAGMGEDTLVSSVLYGSGSGSGCLGFATALLERVLFVFSDLAFPPFDPAETRF